MTLGWALLWHPLHCVDDILLCWSNSKSNRKYDSIPEEKSCGLNLCWNLSLILVSILVLNHWIIISCISDHNLEQFSLSTHFHLLFWNNYQVDNYHHRATGSINYWILNFNVRSCVCVKIYKYLVTLTHVSDLTWNSWKLKKISMNHSMTNFTSSQHINFTSLSQCFLAKLGVSGKWSDLYLSWQRPLFDLF